MRRDRQDYGTRRLIDAGEAPSSAVVIHAWNVYGPGEARREELVLDELVKSKP